MITRMENFLNEYDIFICPVSSVLAFKHHAPSKSYGNFSIYNNPLSVNGQEIHYYMATQAYTTPFTLTESPVLSMPIALSKESMPISIQVIGKRYGDFRLLEVGKVIENYAVDFSFPAQK
jgi:amidase